jgi:anionic cell wall polymer biosynthesis LytR-Cps2A-Psr (LCP) family protein
MSRFRLRLLIGLISFVVIAGVLVLVLRKPAQEITAATPPIESVVQNVLANRAAVTIAAGAAPFGEDDVINVLVLGLDSRKEGMEQHCDAIHLVAVNVVDWMVKVTSVPRGTYSYIPPGNYAPTDYYLANACAFAGLDYGIAQIEHILGVKADYVVTAGFSQVLGSLRVLGLPTTSSLQWLRHRQSYQIGDPQRSQNQAVFLVDVLSKFGNPDKRLPTTLQYLIYSFVNTEMDFGTARALYDGLVAADITSNPERITYDMKPFYETQNLHLDFANADAQVAILLDRIRGRVSTADLSDRTIADVQDELILYLQKALDDGDPEFLVVVEAESWRQVEDEATREELHFAYVDKYANELAGTDKEAAVQFVADYILEKQTLGLSEWESKGRDLLTTLVVQ